MDFFITPKLGMRNCFHSVTSSRASVSGLTVNFPALNRIGKKQLFQVKILRCGDFRNDYGQKFIKAIKDG